MTDYLPAVPGFPPMPTGNSSPPASQAPSSELSQQEIEAILARAESEHKAKFQGAQISRVGVFSVYSLLARGTLARLLFAVSGLILVNNGVDGLKTKANSSDSLIAISINNQGGQSVGLGFAMLAFAVMPYPSRHGE